MKERVRWREDVFNMYRSILLCYQKEEVRFALRNTLCPVVRHLLPNLETVPIVIFLGWKVSEALTTRRARCCAVGGDQGSKSTLWSSSVSRLGWWDQPDSQKVKFDRWSRFFLD
ncbi:hypothetical protein AVEN_12735-1 [Araneus ventricosus]|uniref:Uncharacterized protein n=1 Tax=Araneus ventricosus TaxID=182803 RepID=A0A4Y2AB99_ARAVE|nr:hypothetical protein AVEN_12735-1 [Araneus ventricosus]